LPTYEYRCEDCGHVFEVRHGMTDEPDLECPRCEGEPTRLISGGAGLIFKGSGFYATDYGSSASTSCGRNSPCCGRDEPCDERPCEG
jgi:putative FmdB family regulatory protein